MYKKNAEKLCKNIFERKKPFVLNHHCYIQVPLPLVEGFVAPLSTTHGQPRCYYPSQVVMVTQGNGLVSHLSLCNKSDFQNIMSYEVVCIFLQKDYFLSLKMKYLREHG